MNAISRKGYINKPVTDLQTSKRAGTLVEPIRRLNQDQIAKIHAGSLQLLDNPGILCSNEKAASCFRDAGCRLMKHESRDKAWRVCFPQSLVEECLASVPVEVILGARNPRNRLVLNARVPEVYFGTGSEANVYQTSRIAEFEQRGNPALRIQHPIYHNHRGSIARLCESSKLCNALPQVDFFIRNVNIQDEDIAIQNKDVNTALAALMYMTKHVQMGLTHLESLDPLMKLAEISAGGPEAFTSNPVLSFIACVIKSPLQLVDDTAEKLMTICERRIPLVISSSPQGGSTAPIGEEGMTTLINAEILAGITLTQIINPGTPVLYGAVPVRTRMDTLHDLYGTPEFIHYNVDCIQMARFYEIPCYSTAGVGDAKVPGLQATVEKLFSQLFVAAAGAQYVHYAFGLLDKTNIFSPFQAVLDDAHIAIVRRVLSLARFGDKDIEAGVSEVRKVITSSSQLFVRHIRKAARKGLVSPPYPFESCGDEDRVLIMAQDRLEALLDSPDDRLENEIIEKIYAHVPGLLPIENFILNHQTIEEGA
jgi:trimethylamine--corrinoid protein Co-methyltransferase